MLANRRDDDAEGVGAESAVTLKRRWCQVPTSLVQLQARKPVFSMGAQESV